MTAEQTEKRFKVGDTEAPAAAFQFVAASAVKFAAGDQSQSKSKPFEMVVRTGAPVPHWYFGMVVHDFAGMKTKPVVAVDWCHDVDKLVGKAGEFDSTSGDLVARGSVESIQEGDQADKIIKLSAVGIPFEASIYFDPYELLLENVPEGFVAEVNGHTVEGPVVIAREWFLRRIAICPSGIDGASEVRFSASSDATAFSLNVKECPTMTKTPAPAADPIPATTAATPATATEMSADDSRTKFQAELKRYTDKFGAADGATYFAAGFNYEQALEKHLEKNTEATKAAEAAKLSAEQRLAAINLGEKSAVDSGGTAAGPAKTTFSSCFKAATEKANKAIPA